MNRVLCIEGEKGWRSGEIIRLPRRPPTNVARVAGSRPCSETGFSPGTPVFPSPQKLTFLNSNSICMESEGHRFVTITCYPR